MGFWLPLLLFFASGYGILALESTNVSIIVKGSVSVAETNEHFVCATIDWWPPEKCNYNQCPWGQSSVLNLDINHPFLAAAIQAFNTLRIRVGGSLQDQVVYGVKGLEHPCLPFEKTVGSLFGFSKGCLSMDRWDEINSFFNRTGAIVTFGINALYGRHHVKNHLWGGAWDSSNARDFIEYTISKGYKVDSWEFGNELSGRGIGARVEAEQYGRDLIHFRAILDELYEKSHTQHLLLAPGGFFDEQWYSKLLQVSGSGIVNAMTHHIYNLGPGTDPHLAKKILDPQYLNRIADIYKNVQSTIKNHGPWALAWVGEAGGVPNNGGRLVSNTFIDSFWYLDQLGMASTYNTKAYCRQTLIGGHYGLLDRDTFIPNPDYYSALLWHRLMGKKVLSVDFNGHPHLRAYTHCRKQKEGISLLLINLSNNTEYNVAIKNDINANLNTGVHNDKGHSFTDGLKWAVSWIGTTSTAVQTREEYHLTAENGNLQSKTMLLNGTPLQLTEGGGIPPLTPAHVPVASPLIVAPLSIVFVTLPNFEAEACV
ncbi:heparanase-like protein 1 isoform X1 [Dioscorea cayenensis subsp. rotundata]|uniref:Heparanase-like protein 1 isoform X1 n=1 Tax=Dioscorea cayennensis subsp. rotundata TaxID=55577 RepID=A0AB40AI30_DIOCR|nr:heparanase-like protein 1 isoform X1 [Dioscorea cayenensis subsp. rotundata]